MGVLQFKGSEYVVPTHHLDETGRLLIIWLQISSCRALRKVQFEDFLKAVFYKRMCYCSRRQFAFLSPGISCMDIQCEQLPKGNSTCLLYCQWGHGADFQIFNEDAATTILPIVCVNMCLWRTLNELFTSNDLTKPSWAKAFGPLTCKKTFSAQKPISHGQKAQESFHVQHCALLSDT